MPKHDIKETPVDTLAQKGREHERPSLDEALQAARDAEIRRYSLQGSPTLFI